MPKVLITRPRKEAERLASTLAQQGYDAVTEPMLIIEATEAPPPFKGHNSDCDYDSIMITSGNTFDVLTEGQHDLTPLYDSPCYCVGSQTAQKARQYGFKNVKFTTDGGLALAHSIKADNVRNILHICAHDVASSGRDDLLAAGIKVTPWAIYSAELVDNLSPATIALLKSHSVNIVLFYSARSATNFAYLIKQAGLIDHCAPVAALCLSPTVASPLQDIKWKCCKAAPEPSEEALLELLLAYAPVASAR